MAWNIHKQPLANAQKLREKYAAIEKGKQLGFSETELFHIENDEDVEKILKQKRSAPVN
jgi:hypothetical protein